MSSVSESTSSRPLHVVQVVPSLAGPSTPAPPPPKEDRWYEFRQSPETILCRSQDRASYGFQQFQRHHEWLVSLRIPYTDRLDRQLQQLELQHNMHLQMLQEAYQCEHKDQKTFISKIKRLAENAKKLQKASHRYSKSVENYVEANHQGLERYPRRTADQASPTAISEQNSIPIQPSASPNDGTRTFQDTSYNHFGTSRHYPPALNRNAPVRV